MAYSDTFHFVIGDYENTNASKTLSPQLAIMWNAPAISLQINSAGYVQIQYGYGGASAERINIEKLKTH